MQSRSFVAACVVVLCLSAACSGTAFSQGSPPLSQSGPPRSQSQSVAASASAGSHQSVGSTVTDAGGVRQATAVERDSVLIRIDVNADGTAHWRVEYRTRLDDENTTAAFDGLKRDIEANPDAYSRDFFEGIRGTIATAENATGREMSGANFSVHTDVRQLPQEYGVVVYSFDWRGFAASESRTLRVGDALSGFFLGENERLLVTWADGYEVADVQPNPDARREQSVLWTGPLDFGPDEPRVRLTPTPAPLGTAVRVAVGALAIGGVLGGLLWLRRRGFRAGTGRETPADGGAGSELLSNEERVVRLLEQRGGRAKQQDVVEALGWTEAKTSQVVTALREDGRIDSFRLGRENVLSLPDHGDETP